MADSSSSKSSARTSTRGVVRSSSRVVSSTQQQGTQVSLQAWAQSARGEVSRSEKSVFVSGPQSVMVRVRASADNNNAASSFSFE